MLGGPHVAPLVDGCVLKCSSDAGIVVEGRAAPHFRACRVTARRAAALTLDAAAPVFERCQMREGEEQGLRAHDRSRPTLRGCRLARAHSLTRSRGSCHPRCMARR